MEQQRCKSSYTLPVPRMKGVRGNNGGPIAARFAESSAEMCYQDDIKHERKDMGQGWKGGGQKKVGERGKKGEEAREGRIEAPRRSAPKARKIAAGGNERASIEGINEEQRCRVAMCEGAIEKVREKERARERERERETVGARKGVDRRECARRLLRRW